MANGGNAASGSATYRVVRELGSRTLRAYAAIREPHELVVLQRFVQGAPGLTARADGATLLGEEGMTHVLRDAQCLAKHWHPNIARVRHVDVDGPEVMLATDLVDGMTLADLFAASSGVPLLPHAVMVRILVDVLAGLSALHGLRDGTRALGAIHGELCPTNIVVGRDGVARLVSCVRRRPVCIGATSEALAYAAPEALEEAGTKDVRSDVYAVGVILWEALMGIRPYEASDPVQLLARQRAEEVVSPVIDEASPFAKLGEIAMRAIAFEPSLRYRTAAEMATALRKLAGPIIAAGSTVATKVAELAGDRIRARRAELDPTATARRPGPVPAPPVTAPPRPPPPRKSPPPAPALALPPAPALALPPALPLPPAPAPEPPAPEPTATETLGAVVTRTPEPTSSEPPPPRKPRGRVAVALLLGAAVVILLMAGVRSIGRSDPPPVVPAAAPTTSANANAEANANANANAEANANANANANAKEEAKANEDDAAPLLTAGPPPPPPPAPPLPKPTTYEPLGI